MRRAEPGRSLRCGDEPRDLPSTEGLLAFLRAARALSFKRAASELHVSASALTRRIQALEAHLGVRLFKRLNPGLELTPDGQRYREEVGEALAQLTRAQAGFLRPETRPLRVSALPAFCENWLVPRLPEFEHRHPELTIEIEATHRYADFAGEPVDVAIRFGTGPWSDLHAEPIVRFEIQPVCSPQLASRLAQPGDLEQHTLIHVRHTPRAWSTWLAAAGHKELVPQREVAYDHVALAVRAAESSQGVVLSTPLLCERQLADGRLVPPFDLPIATEATYHFVCRPTSLADSAVVALRDWLVESLECFDSG